MRACVRTHMCVVMCKGAHACACACGVCTCVWYLCVFVCGPTLIILMFHVKVWLTGSTLKIVLAYAKSLVAWFKHSRKVLMAYVEVWRRDSKVNIVMVNVKVQVWGSKFEILTVYVKIWWCGLKFKIFEGLQRRFFRFAVDECCDERLHVHILLFSLEMLK